MADFSTAAAPVFAFGIIADLHFLDAENGSNFDGTKVRRFRQSLEMLFRASDSFLEAKTTCNIMLGDIIDGKAKGLGKQMPFLDEVLDITVRTDRSWHVVLGNHEYYNFTRDELFLSLIPLAVKPQCAPTKLYYSFSPHPGYKFMILDGYEMSTMGAVNPELQQQAVDLITLKNHNYAAGSNDWFKDLAQENKRYVPFNGGISNEQLGWLGQELAQAAEGGEKCVVFCHMALNVKASQENNLLWNCEEVLETLYKTPKGTVMACIAGHDHNGGYDRDHHGIYHLVPPAPIECGEGENTFGRVEVFEDKLQIVWTGKRPVSD
ncbi:unnamed protein product, partial [Ectocarpus fasciculatus]